MTPILALVLSFVLHWQAAPGAYIVERQVSNSWVAVDTFTTMGGACVDTFEVAEHECYAFKGRHHAGTVRSASTFHALALDWSGKAGAMAVEFQGRGSLPYTLVKVKLPSPQWTCTYAFQDSIPIYVKATCDHDYNRDDVVNLLDLYYFAVWYYKNGGTLSDFAMFGNDYQQVTREWR